MKELWENEKGKAGITLTIWLIFIGLVIAMASCGSSKNDVATKEPKKEKISIATRIESLLESDYSFEMTKEKNDGSSKIVFEATKYVNEETKAEMFKGYVKTKDGINEFRCGDFKTSTNFTPEVTCHKVLMDHEEEDSSYLTVVNIMKIVKNNYSKLEEKEPHNYLFNGEDQTLKVIDNEDETITKMIIENAEEKITIDFNYNK